MALMADIKTLKPIHYAFVDEYCVHRNATKAAENAGYSKNTAGSQGSRLLKDANIKALIGEKLKTISHNLEITAERVLQEYAKIAFANSDDYFEWSASSVNLKPSDMLTRDQKAAISSIKETTTEHGGALELKLHDKQKALDALARHLELFDGDSGANDPDITIIFETYNDSDTIDNKNTKKSKASAD